MISCLRLKGKRPEKRTVISQWLELINWWNKSSSQARGSNDSNPTRDSDDSSEEVSYAVRRSREVPDDRPSDVYLCENHIEYCYGFRLHCSWKDSQQYTRLSRERGMCSIVGLPDMPCQYQIQIAMDVLS